MSWHNPLVGVYKDNTSGNFSFHTFTHKVARDKDRENWERREDRRKSKNKTNKRE